MQRFAYQLKKRLQDFLEDVVVLDICLDDPGYWDIKVLLLWLEQVLYS